MPRSASSSSARLPDDPRKFFRVATRRFAEAQFLFEGERYAVSIHLAGYSAECGLKALILSTVPKARQGEVAISFRGGGWHNLNRSIEVYLEGGGVPPPAAIFKDLTYVHDEWSVELRYLAGETPFREAERFVHSIDRILEWVKRRF